LISTRASAIAKPGVLVGHERRCRNRPGESLGPDLIERRHVVDVRQVDVGLDDVAGAEAGAGERREELLADQIDRLELDAVALPQMAVGHLGLGRDAAQVARLMRRQKARHENQVAGLDHRHERRGRGDIEAIGKDRLDRRPVGRDRDHVGHHGGARDQHLRLQDRRVGSDIGAAGGAPRLVKKRDRAPVLKKLIAAHQPRHVGAAGAQDIGRALPDRFGLPQPRRRSRTRPFRVSQVVGHQTRDEHPVPGTDTARQRDARRSRFADGEGAGERFGGHAA
jgi:hypothetical protein